MRLAVAAWASTRFPAAEDGHYYDVLARRLASGAGFTWLWPDGAVTYVAHYPVGYPALLAAAYAVFGASAGTAMTLNAIVGAAGAGAAQILGEASGATRAGALAAGLIVALHPALVPYTAAMMTEGVNSSLLVVAAAAAWRARGADRPWAWLLVAGVVMGVAILVRPQSLILAPVFGALAAGGSSGWRPRLARAAVTTAVALACVAPWTARNCVRMHRCALVSVNGGWNLLIGATSPSGAWAPISVPTECATVWDEAGKDVCFERAATRAIGRAPWVWLERAPSKLAVTFDYFGAAPWYLHASSPGSFGDRAKMRLGAVETIASRLLLLAALAACARLAGARAVASRLVLAAGAVAAVTVHAWIAYLAIPLALALAGRRAWFGAPVALPMAAAVIGAPAAVHAVFFGAGRYGLVVVPFVVVLAACAASPRAPEVAGTSPGVQD